MVQHDSTNRYINALRRGDMSVVKDLYEEYLPKISKLIIRKGGDISDVKDIMQLTVTALWKNVQKEEFQLTTKLGAYLNSIALNYWKTEIRRKSRWNFVTISQENIYMIGQTEELNIEHLEQVRLFDYYFNKLKPRCKELILLIRQGFSLKEISEKLEVKAPTIRKRKERCMETFRASIAQDPAYRELKN